MIAHVLMPFMMIGWFGAAFFALPGILIFWVSPKWSRRLGWLAILSGAAQLVAFVLAVGLSSVMFDPIRLFSPVGPLVLWTPPILLGICAVILGWVFDRPRSVNLANACSKCGYLLHGLIEPRCPECGTPCLLIETRPIPVVESAPSWRSRGSIALWGLAATVALACIVAWFVREPQEPFDPAKWRRIPHAERAPMADDLVMSRRLIGLTCDEVVAVLGAPDVYDFSYKIGARYQNLRFDIDEAGQVVCEARGSESVKSSATFDASVWHATPSVEREPMAVSLSQNPELFTRKSRSQIVAMLGNPDDGDALRYAMRNMNDAVLVRLRDNRVIRVSYFKPGRP